MHSLCFALFSCICTFPTLLNLLIWSCYLYLGREVDLKGNGSPLTWLLPFWKHSCSSMATPFSSLSTFQQLHLLTDYDYNVPRYEHLGYLIPHCIPASKAMLGIQRVLSEYLYKPDILFISILSPDPHTPCGEWDRYNPHYTDEETEILRGWGQQSIMANW